MYDLFKKNFSIYSKYYAGKKVDFFDDFKNPMSP